MSCWYMKRRLEEEMKQKQMGDVKVAQSVPVEAEKPIEEDKVEKKKRTKKEV